MPPYIFIGHRFTKEYMDDFREAVRLAVGQYGDVQIMAADFQYAQGHILKDKIQPLIDRAWFCIFDITDETKPNVFIELGYAYGKSKFVILTSRTQPPTDLAGYDVIIYDSFKELREKLAQYLPQIMYGAARHSGKEVASIPIVFLDITYDLENPDRSTPKAEIYKKMPLAEANECIRHLAAQGLLNNNDDSVSYTIKGQEVIGNGVRFQRGK